MDSVLENQASLSQHDSPVINIMDHILKENQTNLKQHQDMATTSNADLNTNDIPVATTTPPPIPAAGMPTRDINALSYKLSVQEKKKQESKSYKYVPYRAIDQTQLDDYLNNQKEKHLTKSSWRTLDMSFKWAYINEYLGTLTVKPEAKKKLIAYCKNLLQQNKLPHVLYDNKNRKIESLGIKYNYGKDQDAATCLEL